MSNNEKEDSLSLMVRAQYVRDLSFENPNPAFSFGLNPESQPNISVNVQVQSRELGDRNYEVLLNIRVEASVGEETMFITDLSYGSIATVGENIPDDKIPYQVMVETPRVLFPFARQTVFDLIQKGNYPPFLMQPIDFLELFENQQNQS